MYVLEKLGVGHKGKKRPRKGPSFAFSFLSFTVLCTPLYTHDECMYDFHRSQTISFQWSPQRTNVAKVFSFASASCRNRCVRTTASFSLSQTLFSSRAFVFWYQYLGATEGRFKHTRKKNSHTSTHYTLTQIQLHTRILIFPPFLSLFPSTQYLHTNRPFRKKWPPHRSPKRANTQSSKRMSIFTKSE